MTGVITMRRNITMAVIVFSLCISFTSYTSGKMKSDAQIEQELMQLEHDWSAAYLKHDIATIDRMLADDFVGIDGRGIMTNKAAEIEDAKGPKPGDPQPSFLVLDDSITDMKVRLYGNTAVVNGRSIEKVKVKEKELEIQYRRTTVWVKRQGRWQCVSFHGSRIIEPTKT
jgi:ketosteroid isomerase-like protein